MIATVEVVALYRIGTALRVSYELDGTALRVSYELDAASRWTSSHPRNGVLCVGQSLDIGGENFARMTVQRKPTLKIFRVLAEFLDAERTIVAHEDIDAIIVSRAFKRRYDKLCHADSARTRNVR